ncbi:MAG: flavodoxin domain-containing protein [Spirochaetaceae bacterium]|nr:flavodoxin domain-containing protein [Spirochaetaceae bacterium]
MSINVLIVFGSSKGRTGRIAEILSDALTAKGLTTVLKNVFEARPKELLDYRYIVLGSSTYGQGDLQRDFLDFERGMDDLDLTGIKAAIFGSGNSRYAYYAEAVDILEAKVKIQGARLILPSFRQDMMMESPDGEEVLQWTQELADTIHAGSDIK